MRLVHIFILCQFSPSIAETLGSSITVKNSTVGTLTDEEILLLNIRLDAKPFLDAILRLLAHSSSDCSIPQNAIMFTYTNHNMFDLIVLQHKAMEVGNVRSCLESRFITICLDNKCMNLCKNHSIPNCVRIVIPKIPHSDFGGKSYGFFTWIKHEFMYEATKVADQIFFFDADVAILRNPWLEISYARDRETGAKLFESLDMQFQRERGINYKGCDGSANSGQLYIRNSTSIQNYFKKLFEKKYEIIIKRIKLDQDYVQEIAVTTLKYCTLPVKHFIGHCISSRDRNTPLMGVIAFHANCAKGTQVKSFLLSKFIDSAKFVTKDNKYIDHVL